MKRSIRYYCVDYHEVGCRAGNKIPAPRVAFHDFYGAERKGQNFFGNSLVALNAATGKLLWYYQMVHHDIWDYDLPAQPSLITLDQHGRKIPAVDQVTKMGFGFVLDRLTGKPTFPVEDRPVPQIKVPGEATWPTHQIQLIPNPVSQQHPINRDDNA